MQQMKKTPVKMKQRPAVAFPVMVLLDCVTATLQLLETWRQRHRSSMQLARLESRTLRDIGISDSRRFVEVNKPFWEE